jgi:hypothetical protein
VADAAEAPELTPAQLLAMAQGAAPYDVMVAAVMAMYYALPPLIGARGATTFDELDKFHGLIARSEWWSQAHQLIVDHPGLPPDALWLYLTARELFPKQAESFAELPEWQRDGFALVIAVHQALWGVIRPALDRQEFLLREQEQAAAPRPRVKLSDTIFEKHDRIDALVDGLRVNPRH